MKTKQSLRSNPLALILTLLIYTTVSVDAGYRPTGPIETWKLSSPTDVHSVDNPEEILTTLRKNLKVEVLDIDTRNDTWTVLYEQPGNDPVIGTIRIPDQSLVMDAAFRAVEPLVETFPLLKSLMESDLPWQDRLDQLAASPDEEPYLTFWDTTASNMSVQKSANGEYLKLELWSKKDKSTTSNPTMTRTTLRQNLGRLTRAFDLNGISYEPSASAKLSSATDTTTWILPNDVVATVRYQPGDHLALIFESYGDLQSSQPDKPDPYEIADRMKARNYTSDGGLFLAGIPMPGNGRGRFGPYAPLASLVAYYGYPTDNRLGSFTSFDSNSGKMSYGNMLRASRRFCIGTPLRLRPLSYRTHQSFDDIRNKIEEGHPILLLSSGNLCVITGYHPDSREILYRDSWDRDSELRTMSWQDFARHKRRLWILAP